MKLTGKKIEDYFKSIDLIESLLLELKFNERKKELKLVFDVPPSYSSDKNSNTIDHDKEWVMYVFKDISNYERIKGTDLLLSQNLNNYLLKRNKRNKVVHFFHVSSTENSCLAEIDFGDFGIVKLEFTILCISILYGKARREPTTWSYIDVLSGNLIDYYDPFWNGSEQ